MELWQFISLVVTTISVAIAGTWRVSSLMNAQRIETRDLLAELRRDNQRAHDEIGKRIETQGEKLSERIDAQGLRIDAHRHELGDRIGALAVQVARLVGREEGRDPL